MASEIFNIKSTNEENVKTTVTQVEFEAKLQILERNLEEKSVPTNCKKQKTETDYLEEIDTLEMENKERVLRIFADLKADYNDTLEKGKK